MARKASRSSQSPSTGSSKKAAAARQAAEPLSGASSATTSVEAPSGVVTHDQIASKARDIWMSRGRPAGQDLEIWLEAERALAC